MKLLALLAVLPLSFAKTLSAETTAAFLKIPVDARGVGIGGGIAALAEGAGSVAHNPAGLSLGQFKELSMLYAPHVQGTDLGFIAYGQPTRFGAFGLSHLLLRSGGLDGRDDEGRPTGGFSAEDRAIGVSFARPLSLLGESRTLFVGGHAKYVTSRIGGYEGSTFAFDLGAQAGHRIGRFPARLGLAVRNLGPGLALQERKDPLPLNVAFGVSIQPLSPVTVSVGGTRYLASQRNELSAGAEVSPFSNLFVRGNYGMVRTAGAASQALPSMSWGMGFRFARYQFDYAFMPLGELGSTQRLNLTMRFGQAMAVPALGFNLARPEAQLSPRELAYAGWTAVTEGRLAEAALDFQRALDAEPGNERVYRMLVRVREVMVDFPMIRGGEAWATFARRGIAAWVDGRDLREAAVFLRKAYEAASPIVDAARRVGNTTAGQAAPVEGKLLALLNRVEAEARLPEPTRRSADVASAGFVAERLAGARQAIYEGRYKLGARRAHEALELEPRNARALEILGTAHYLMGATVHARRAWEQALRIEPHNRIVAEYLEKVK